MIGKLSIGMDAASLYVKPVIERLARADSKAQAFGTWFWHRRALKDSRLILALPDGIRFPVPNQLDLPDGAYLRGLYRSDHLVYLDNRTVWQTFAPGGTTIVQDYSITFDTQVVRYLALAIEGASHPMAHAIRSALTYLSARGWNWDFWAYIEENADRLTRTQVYASRNFRANLQAIEIVKDLDEPYFLATGVLRPQAGDREIDQRVERLLVYIETRPDSLKAYYRSLQRLCYLVLLVISWIHLKQPKRPVKAKIQELLRFFDEELCTMLPRELVYGIRLFEEGHRLSFFSRVQRSHPQLLESLQNMAWDLLTARRMEMHQGVGAVEGRYYLQYLLTYDQDLVHLMDAYSLKGTLLLPDGQAMPFPAVDLQEVFQRHDFSYLDVKPYFDRSGRQRRIDQHAERRPDLDALIHSYETRLKGV
ncbi:hypothetical protein [Deinococcus wulumuqiensis]|uniref:DUF2357 domain-containing protein n=1 Tax=Deinococcus wulumuqiensis TaxID=980427 RepID=A0AAV4KDH5_9DEIO|nr:hypothetical protein [Deinococcus wulumuqiensis]QII22317.1 hypothetical protein G6R31_15775 [Deinococcus wulumuqiensis R12]GGI69661.1 hypothetical protein GCM10008021_32240 [Deinococcus wulumuqiensis]GGI95006.1 hypothetical protein GCM10010914_31910 [Deinococcus wulumuqiensis]